MSRLWRKLCAGLAVGLAVGGLSSGQPTGGNPPGPKVADLAWQLDDAGFFARIGTGLRLSFAEEAEVPGILLAKYHATELGTKAVLVHAADSILKRGAPKLTKFPLAWAKEDLADRRWMDALALATHDSDLFDLGARKLYIDALKELWKDALAANPAMKKQVFPRIHHEEWHRGEKIRGSPLGTTVIAKEYTPISAMIGSVFFCDKINLDQSVGIGESVVLCRESVQANGINNSIVITPRGITLRGHFFFATALSGERLPENRTYSHSLTGSFHETYIKKIDLYQGVMIQPKEMQQYWKPSASALLGVLARDAAGRITIQSPPEKAIEGVILKGDVILEINGRPTHSPGDVEVVAPHPRLSEIYVTLLRDKTVRVVKATPSR